MKDVSIHGFTIFRVANNPKLLDHLIEMGMNSAAALRPEIHKRFDLAGVPTALDYLGRSEHLGKLVIQT
jgi:hypothetical protein